MSISLFGLVVHIHHLFYGYISNEITGSIVHELEVICAYPKTQLFAHIDLHTRIV
jgi:hypothetical protein